MEPIEALNRPIKESHKYILAMYANGSYLYILLQHTENRDEIVTERLPLTSEKGVSSIEEAVFSQPILTDRPTSNGSENTFRPKHKAVVFRETHVRPPRTATQAGSGVRILFQKKPIGIYV